MWFVFALGSAVFAALTSILQIGAASKVVPVDKLSVVITLALAFVILHEPFNAKSLLGCALITAGTLCMVL